MKSIQKFDSGITLITDKNMKTSTVTFCVYFKVGSAYESDRIAGITNLTMNMFFRKLGDIQQPELYSSMEKLGGEIKGIVSYDYTCFKYTVLSCFASKALELILKIFGETEWSQEDLINEKKIALKKIEFSDNDYDYCLFKQTGRTPYKRSIIGSKDSVNGITFDELNKWKKRYFIPSNACLVIAGNFDKKVIETTEKAIELFEYIPAPKNKIFVPLKAFNRKVDDYLLRKKNLDPAEIRLFFDVDMKNIKTNEFLTTINLFGLGVGGKLPYYLKDIYALTDCVDFDVYYTKDYATIDIDLYVNTFDIERTLDVIGQCIVEMKTNITKDFFDTGILFNTLNESKYYDTSETLADLYGYYDFVLNKSYSVEESISAKDEITPESIMELANLLFRPENLFLCINSTHKKSKVKEYVKCFCELLN